jgi:asparagine synthase (glutamine-hydrolysing)
VLVTSTAHCFIARTADGGVSIAGDSSHTSGGAVAGGPSASWHWTGDRLIVANDRHGVVPLFWWCGRGTMAISPSIDALLAAGAPPDLDDGAMAVFLRAGFFVGEDTPFTAIRALPPSARLEWTPAGLSIESAWRWPPATAASRDEIIERFGRGVAEVVARQASDTTRPLTVLLSGGHDSRHILFALHEAGVPAQCVTVEPYPPAAPQDVALARQVASSVGADHVVLRQRTRRIPAEREKNRLTSYCADEHVQFLPLRDYFATRTDLLFDGLAGDVLSQGQRFDPALHRAFVDGRFAVVADRTLGDPAAIEPALAGLLSRRALARFSRAAAVDRVRAEAARHAAAPNPIASFFFFTRMRREIALAPYGVLDVAAVATPFLDPALVDLLMAVPFDLVRDRRLHTETLQRRYSRLAHIPFDSKQPGADVPALVRRDALGLMARLARYRGRLIDRRAAGARTSRALATGRSAHLWFLPTLLQLMDVEEHAAAGLSRSAPRSPAGRAM